MRTCAYQEVGNASFSDKMRMYLINNSKQILPLSMEKNKKINEKINK